MAAGSFRRTGFGGTEGFTAAAGGGGGRVGKTETTFHHTLNKIKLDPAQGTQAGRFNEEGDTATFKTAVLRFGLGHQFHVVTKAGAAAIVDADPHAGARPQILGAQQAPESQNGRFSQLDAHGDGPK